MTVSRVFVANRGEIAVPIVRAHRELGLECVLGASEVDRNGPAVRLADRAEETGYASVLAHEDCAAGRITTRRLEEAAVA
jgi:acetyl/propionyl-CoA carboxylase alpha subunit